MTSSLSISSPFQVSRPKYQSGMRPIFWGAFVYTPWPKLRFTKGFVFKDDGDMCEDDQGLPKDRRRKFPGEDDDTPDSDGCLWGLSRLKKRCKAAHEGLVKLVKTANRDYDARRVEDDKEDITSDGNAMEVEGLQNGLQNIAELKEIGECGAMEGIEEDNTFFDDASMVDFGEEQSTLIEDIAMVNSEDTQVGTVSHCSDEDMKDAADAHPGPRASLSLLPT